MKIKTITKTIFLLFFFLFSFLSSSVYAGGLDADEMDKLQEILQHLEVVTDWEGDPVVQVSGANFQVVDGSGNTANANGKGNFIIGYNDFDPNSDSRLGSHNFIIGDLHSYGYYSTFSAGKGHDTNGKFSVAIGFFHDIELGGRYSNISGGILNTTTELYSFIGGGDDNEANGLNSAVMGGHNNVANGSYSVVSGGNLNTADGDYSSVGGGYQNTATGDYSTVSGGANRTSLGIHDWVGGGLTEDN